MSKDKVETLEKPKRVHQIAKELNIASVEVLDFLKERKYPIKNMNIMTKVDEKMYNDILLRFQSEKVRAEKKIEYRRKKLKNPPKKKLKKYQRKKLKNPPKKKLKRYQRKKVAKNRRNNKKKLTDDTKK